VPPDELPEALRLAGAGRVRPNPVLARARRSVPQAVKPALRVVAGAVDPLRVARYRRASGYERPIPRRTLRARIGEGRVKPYVEDGLRVTGGVAEVAWRAGVDIREPGSVLDLGAGAGRLLVHLEAIRGGPDGLAACDVDAEAIRWLAGALPGIEARVNSFDPPLPFDDDQFDLLYCISILTHMDEATQDRWLAEIRRVVKPGGLALISVLGVFPYDETRDGTHPAALTQGLLKRLRTHGPLADEGFVFEPYEITAGSAEQFPGISGNYGIAFQHYTRVAERWTEQFELVEHHHLAIQGFQDLVALRKIQA
jgi:SAM-dependent methyltransferase